MKMDKIRLGQGLKQVIFAYSASSEKGVLIKEAIVLQIFQVFLKPHIKSSQ